MSEDVWGALALGFFIGAYVGGPLIHLLYAPPKVIVKWRAVTPDDDGEQAWGPVK